MENKILKKINYSIDIKYFSTLTLFTIFSCYIIAVLKGQFPPFGFHIFLIALLDIRKHIFLEAV